MQKNRFLKQCGMVVLAALFLFVSMGVGSTAVSAQQSQQWSTPIPLSSSGAFSWFPDIATDSLGQLHVAWASGVTGYDAVIYTESPDGQAWKKVNDIAALAEVGNRADATRPTLLVDNRGLIHVTYVNTSIYYSHSAVATAYSASSWSPAMQINGDQVGYFSRMAVDSNNVLHLVYTENTPSLACPSCYHLYYRQSKDNGSTWSEPVDISVGSDGAAKPQILIDKKDNIHVVWESGQGGGLGQLSDPTTVKYTASYDGGKTWSTPVEFTSPDVDMEKNIAIGEDMNGSLVIAWWGIPKDAVYYQLSDTDGRSWSNPVVISNVWGAWEVYQSRLDDYSMATDSGGNIHLVMVGRLFSGDSTLSVLDLVWNGKTWSSPDPIVTLNGDAPEWPRVAISNGNQLNVVWFVRDQAHIWDSSNGQYQVWYARGTSNSPAEQPAPIPTWQPTPTVQSTSDLLLPTPAGDKTAQPTATGANLDPTLSPSERIPGDALYSETDYLKVIAKALIPTVALLLGALVAYWLIRRR